MRNRRRLRDDYGTRVRVLPLLHGARGRSCRGTKAIEMWTQWRQTIVLNTTPLRID
jgi:hypothetical protein